MKERVQLSVVVWWWWIDSGKYPGTYRRRCRRRFKGRRVGGWASAVSASSHSSSTFPFISFGHSPRRSASLGSDSFSSPGDFSLSLSLSLSTGTIAHRLKKARDEKRE